MDQLLSAGKFLEYRKFWWQNYNNGRIERSTKKQNGKSPGKDNLNSELINLQGTYFLNNICMMEEFLEKWKNGIVIPVHKKGEKWRVENCRGVILLNEFYKLYSNILGTVVAQWLRYCATNRKVAVNGIFHWYDLLIALWPWGRLSL